MLPTQPWSTLPYTLFPSTTLVRSPGPPEYPRFTSEARRPYRTRDGYIGVMIYNDKHWRAFFAALGDPEWSRDPIFASMRSRTENIGAVLARQIGRESTRERVCQYG